MKLEQARTIGKECGLETDTECVRNVLIHAHMMFEYANMKIEVHELLNDFKSIHNKEYNENATTP